MLINRDYVTPAELTGYARAALGDLQINQFTLARWLPNREIDDLEFRFARGGDGLVEAAQFRAFDAESSIGARPGVTRVTGELPPISRKIRLGEYDRLRQRRLNEAVGDAILTDAERMTRAVAARLELARGEALYTGKVIINENGYVGVTADFGRAAGHTVNAATAWSTVATATPLADMLSWRDTYIATNGTPPGAALTSTRVLGYLLRNAEIRNLAATVAGTPTIVSQATVNTVLDSYGLPPLHTYDAQVTVGGVATRPIPDDKFLYLPAPVDPNSAEGSELGGTLYGTTAEALELADEIVGEDQPGIVAIAYKTEQPVSIWTNASAIALPVLANPNLSFAADVA
jgi:hypothetical protein